LDGVRNIHKRYRDDNTGKKKRGDRLAKSKVIKDGGENPRKGIIAKCQSEGGANRKFQ